MASIIISPWQASGIDRQRQHALIERAIFGRPWRFFKSRCGVGEFDVYWGGDSRCKAYDEPHWHLHRRYEIPDGSTCYRPPDYSLSLDLCQQFEGKIKEGGYEDMRDYTIELLHKDPLPDDMGYADYFKIATIGPAERVDAAVRLIQSKRTTSD